MKYYLFILNFWKSFFFDIRYFFQFSFKQRCLAFTYSKYAANKLYPQYLKSGGAVDAVKYLALNYCKGKGVDVGSGIWPLTNSRPVENNEAENAYKLNDKDEALDYVFSSHLMEHLDNHQVALEEWRRVLIPGGILFLYLPHPVCKMWAPEVLKEHVWMPDPLYLSKYLPDIGFQIVEMSFLPDAMMSYYLVCKKI